MSWYLAVLKNYAGFRGRARRRECGLGLNPAQWETTWFKADPNRGSRP